MTKKMSVHESGLRRTKSECRTSNRLVLLRFRRDVFGLNLEIFDRDDKNHVDDRENAQHAEKRLVSNVERLHRRLTWESAGI